MAGVVSMGAWAIPQVCVGVPKEAWAGGACFRRAIISQLTHAWMNILPGKQGFAAKVSTSFLQLARGNSLSAVIVGRKSILSSRKGLLNVLTF